eukprot:m.788749 g.788749  ORF g.788749 m.788749 type:complete len:110 (-) comp59196_c1_seq6:28-357(-)
MQSPLQLEPEFRSPSKAATAGVASTNPFLTPATRASGVDWELNLEEFADLFLASVSPRPASLTLPDVTHFLNKTVRVDWPEDRCKRFFRGLSQLDSSTRGTSRLLMAVL